MKWVFEITKKIAMAMPSELESTRKYRVQAPLIYETSFIVFKRTKRCFIDGMRTKRKPKINFILVSGNLPCKQGNTAELARVVACLLSAYQICYSTSNHIENILCAIFIPISSKLDILAHGNHLLVSFSGRTSSLFHYLNLFI